jgi:adenylate cyclase
MGNAVVMIDAGFAIALMMSQFPLKVAQLPLQMPPAGCLASTHTPPVPLELPPEEQLEQLLRRRRQHPQQNQAIDAEIQRRFQETHAILVLDMAGLTRITQEQGIIPALEAIYHLRDIVSPLLIRHHGRLLKAEADNIYGVFDRPDSALLAARDIIEQLRTEEVGASIGIGYGEVLAIGERDLYGNQMNLASRLGEDLAGDNEILLTEAAYQALANPAGEFEYRATVTHGHPVAFYELKLP